MQKRTDQMNSEVESSEAELNITATDLLTTSVKEEPLEPVPSLSSALKNQLSTVVAQTKSSTLVPSRKVREKPNNDQSVTLKSKTFASIDSPKARF